MTRPLHLSALLMTACATLPPPALSWDQLSLRLLLSPDLSTCQVHVMHEAAAFWERKLGQPVFDLEMAMDRDHPALNGLPRYYTIAVVPGGTTDPESLADTDVEYEADGRIHSATIHLNECSARSASHELAHALGLPDVLEPGNLMTTRRLGETSMEVTQAQLDAIVLGTVTRVALGGER